MIAITLWIIIGFFALGALTTVANIGKDRKPITPDVAAVVVLFDLLVIALLVWTLVKA